MKKTVIEIYAVAVCFISVVSLSLTVTIGLYDLLEWGAPEFTLIAYQQQRLESDESYLRHLREIDHPDQELDAAALTRARESEYASALRAERRDAKQSLVRMLFAVVVLSAVLIFHWLLARRQVERAQREAGG